MLEWSLDALRAAGIDGDRGRPARRASTAPAGLRRRARRRDALASPCAPRCAAPAVPADVVVHDAARPLVDAVAVHARARRRSSDADCAIAAARVTDTIKEADDGRRVVATLDRSRLWAIQTPQAFRREALEAALDVDAGGARRARPTTPGWSSARAAPCGSSSPRPRTSRSRRRTTCAWPSLLGARCDPTRAMLTDYHVHLRPDDPGTAAATLLHRRQRRALPRDRRRARRRRARRLRAHPPLHRRARRLAAPVLAPERRRRPRPLRRASCARRPTCGSGSRPTTSAAARTGWRPARRPRLGLRRSARCTSSASTPSTSTTRPTSGATRSTAERVWKRYFEALAESARDRHVRHHRPPGPGQDLGLGAARARPRTRASTTSPRSRRCSRRASRWRSPPPGCASRSARSTRRARCWRWRSTPASRSRCPRDAHRPEHLAFGYEEAREAARATAA